MPFTPRKTPLTNAQRNIIIVMLAEGKTRVEIAERLGKDDSTVRFWIRCDPGLKEAADELLVDVYEKCVERLYDNALANVNPTAETQHKAMMEIINRYEESQRRAAGEITLDGANVLLMQVCAILVDMPEAKRKVIHAYRDARSKIDDATPRPSAVSGTEAGKEPGDP